MIVPMARVRLLGPRGLLPEVIQTLQDLGILHVVAETNPLRELMPFQLPASEHHRRRQLLAWKGSALGFRRDLVRFYESLAVFAWYANVECTPYP